MHGAAPRPQDTFKQIRKSGPSSSMCMYSEGPLFDFVRLEEPVRIKLDTKESEMKMVDERDIF